MRCHVLGCARNRNDSFAVLRDTQTEWLKEKYKESGAPGARGRPGLTKATGESDYQLGIYPRTNGFKLFVCDELSRGNLLGSCEEKLTFNKIIVHRKGKSID